VALLRLLTVPYYLAKLAVLKLRLKRVQAREGEQPAPEPK
jgi:hypothetical protein